MSVVAENHLSGVDVYDMLQLRKKGGKLDMLLHNYVFDSGLAIEICCRQ